MSDDQAALRARFTATHQQLLALGVPATDAAKLALTVLPPLSKPADVVLEEARAQLAASAGALPAAPVVATRGTTAASGDIDMEGTPSMMSPAAGAGAAAGDSEPPTVPCATPKAVLDNKDLTSSPPSTTAGLTYEQVSTLLDEAAVSESYTPVIRLIGSTFSNPDVLDASFHTGPATAAHPGVDLDQVVRFYKRLQTQPNEGVRRSLYHALQQMSAQAMLDMSRLKDTYQLRHFLIALLNPMLSDPDYHTPVVAKLCRCVHSLSDRLQGVLTAWLGALELEQTRELLKALQQYMTLRLYAGETSISELRGPTHVMGLLNDANEAVFQATGRRRLRLEEFYNDVISSEINLRDDYRRWLASREEGVDVFSFCAHSYILDAAAKSFILKFDARRQMESLARESISESLAAGAQAMPYFVLKIKRSNLLEDTLLQIVNAHPKSSLKKPLKVKFVGEEGIDEGGVRKEFFQVLSRQLFDPGFGMFTVEDDGRTLWFSRDAMELHGTIQFELIGSLIGLAIYNSVILDVHFPTVVYRKLVGLTPTLRDLAQWKPEVGANLQKLLDYDKDDVEDVFCLDFTVAYDSFGAMKQVELKPGGASIAVTAANKQEYVDLYVDYMLSSSIAQPFAAFKRGFLNVAECPALDLFRAEELELLVVGSEELDFEALEKSTQYESPFAPTHPTIAAFWGVVHGFTPAQKRKLLSFATGSDRAPIRGLGSLQFVISRAGPDSDQLPTAHTCFNHLLLPEYSSADKMEEKLKIAIEQSQGFGLL